MLSIEILSVLCIILIVLLVILSIKIILLRKAAKEIRTGFSDKLEHDTNTLITLSTRDRHMRLLAADINTQLRLLRTLRRRYQQGDQELKNAVTNISHDLRTPLTAICGYLDLLESEEKSENVQRYLRMITNRTELLRSLTEELFRYSIVVSSAEDPQNTDRKWIDLRGTLEESLAFYYDAMKQKNISPEISMPEDPVRRYLEISSLSRILNNIIGNALKYSDGDFSVLLKEDGTILFSNTAHSLTPVTAARLFDRFYTVETGRNSTGLGLSIAKILTEYLGGSIKADYQNEKLIITLCFPNDDRLPE